MDKFLKKIILFSLCIFLFFPAVTRAEYTCCACQAETAFCRTGGRCEYSRGFAGFACATGNRTCSYVCPNGEFTNVSRSGVGGPITWEAYTGDANIFARGDVVTCCICNDGTNACRAANQTCNEICGTHGFEPGRDAYFRSPDSAGGAEGGGIRTPTPPGTASPYVEPQSSEPISVGFTPPEPQAPKISLPIPGFMGFSQVKVEGTDGEQYISIPWIGEYVRGIYNYMLAIAGGLASFIFIVAGFKYITAHGDRGKIGEAKSMMTNALVGLFMTFGAYLILYTINPELTSFKSIRLDVIKRQEIPFNVAERESFAGDDDTSSSGGGSSPTPSGSSNEYEPMVLRVAEAVGVNGCLLARQIRMESNWNTNAGTGCCFGLGQVHWNYSRSYLSQVARYHSQGCPNCPDENASREVMSNWLRQDPEGNIIIAALMKKGAIRQARNPVAAIAMYGMGSGSYNSFIRATNCQIERYSENQLIERLRGGASAEDLIRTACVPPSTWPLPNAGSTQRSCPPANYCCASATGSCTQPPIRREGGVNQGRWGVCQGGSRDGQECAAVAGGDQYVRSFLSSARRCAQ